MTKPTPTETFIRVRKEIATTAPEGVRDNAVLAVGVLLGGNFPGCAAAVSLLVEVAFPDQEWPWSEARR